MRSHATHAGSTGTGWVEAGTSTHHDHVVAHVVGATVVGYFVADEAAHLLLDIGFFWIIYTDGEMGLVAESTTIAELNVSDEARAFISEDADALRREGTGAQSLALMQSAPADCLVEEVTLYAAGARRRLVIRGAGSSLSVESSVETGEIAVGEL
ncbi:MAG: hypothetical protein QOF61_3195 [Acidobacteriota bacterium]|jgi:hypothetical protein|nr:hypothetical protein [Acidobacteriota bacterium]